MTEVRLLGDITGQFSIEAVGFKTLTRMRGLGDLLGNSTLKWFEKDGELTLLRVNRRHTNIKLKE